MTTYRLLKVAGDVQYVLTHNMREVFAFDTEILDAMITVTKVNLSADLKIANCYVVRGYHSKVPPELVITKLSNVKHIFRKLINKELSLKYSPEIKFFYDFAIDNVDKVSRLLNKITEGE
jgi:ribosome-binding factor A